MNIVLTGATGFIGRHLIKTLQEKDYAVHAVVRNGSDASFLDESGVTYHQDDGSILSLNRFLNEQKIEGVIHLASCFIAEHKPEEIENLIQSNLLFGTRLLEATLGTGIQWFINTGTAWQHFNSQDDYSPVNLYAATKEAFETLSRYYTSVSPLLFVTLKICDTYGRKDTRRKIFNLWSEMVKSGISLDMSPGDQKMDIVHVKDVANAYLKLIQLVNQRDSKSLQNASFAVSSGKPMTLRELATVFEQATLKKLNINWGKRGYRAREVMDPWSSGKTVPSWTPKVTLEEGIRELTRDLQ